jgi:hypothetical protein
MNILTIGEEVYREIQEIPKRYFLDRIFQYYSYTIQREVWTKESGYHIPYYTLTEKLTLKCTFSFGSIEVSFVTLLHHTGRFRKYLISEVKSEDMSLPNHEIVQQVLFNLSDGRLSVNIVKRIPNFEDRISYIESVVYEEGSVLASLQQS